MSTQMSLCARLEFGRPTYRLIVFSLVAILWHTSARAEDDPSPSAPNFSFGAFGTLGVVHSSENRADFTSSVFKPNGAGYTHSWSIDPDTRIAAQVTANVAPRLSVVVQVLSEQTAADNFKPKVEWANLKYQLTPDLSVRAGRIVLPSYLFSDSRNVGFAIPWVRPPVEAYRLNPVGESDGVDLNYKVSTGPLKHTIVGSYGRTEPISPQGRAVARRLWVISESVEYGPTTLHVSYEQATLSISYLSPLFDALRQFGPQGTALAAKYDVDDKRTTFVNFGGVYDPGRWLVTAEWATTTFHSALGKSTGWYVSSGYRLAKFTPYITYAALTADSKTSDPGLNVASLPPSLVLQAQGLNAELNAVLGSIAVQRTTAIGVRWDFMKSVDLKLQYDHTRLGAGSPGTLINLQPAFQRGGSLNIFSATIDFVL